MNQKVLLTIEEYGNTAWIGDLRHEANQAFTDWAKSNFPEVIEVDFQLVDWNNQILVAYVEDGEEKEKTFFGCRYQELEFVEAKFR